MDLGGRVDQAHVERGLPAVADAKAEDEQREIERHEKALARTVTLPFMTCWMNRAFVSSVCHM